MTAWKIKQIFRYFIPFYVFFLLTNCSITRESFKFQENIADYAELLFKRQNFLTQQVMMLSEDEISFADEEMISQAELQMQY